MPILRAFFQTHAWLAASLLALALCMKALVPAGYMIGNASPDSTVLNVQLCTASLDGPVSHQIVIPQDEKNAAPGSQDDGGHDKSHNGVCPYTALSMASLSGADAALLAVALLFILALGFAKVRSPRVERPAFFTPPLRGPPHFA
ncbi:hypothetical protein MB02_02580 [Croceicoccus estronivorus]|uniref:DUF2946 family protein n=1 Tax=Croceicoccus estronivorus TaxID=1172626 RepID=UPI0008363D4A|nr:DUF2946 family protein [Croceicoccus estronivorus]OCC25538.1 hypothetical protein MB02_02580 [Croceicoccus estronivorus]